MPRTLSSAPAVAAAATMAHAAAIVIQRAVCSRLISRTTTATTAAPTLRDALCVVIDIETTGLSTTRDRVTQMAACALVDDAPSDHVPPLFTRYVSPGDRPIPRHVQELTGVFTSDVTGLEELPGAWAKLHAWVDEQVRAHGKRHAWLLGQNTRRFDFPLLCHELRRGYPGDDDAARRAWTMDHLLVRAGDTLPLLRGWPWANTHQRRPPLQPGRLPPRPTFALGAVYAHLFQREIANAHDALGDVLATRDIVQHLPATLREPPSSTAAAAVEGVLPALWHDHAVSSDQIFYDAVAAARRASSSSSSSHPRRRHASRSQSRTVIDARVQTTLSTRNS